MAREHNTPRDDHETEDLQYRAYTIACVAAYSRPRRRQHATCFGESKYAVADRCQTSTRSSPHTVGS